MKITTKLLISIGLIVLVLFIIFNISIPPKYKLDTELTSVYINLVNALVIIVLTAQVYLYNQKKDELDFKQKTPLVSIIQQEYNGGYYIRNIGGGPALNVRILSDLNLKEKIWKKNIIAFDLFGDSTFDLDNSNKEQYLITYNDIYGHAYYSYMKDNQLSFGSLAIENSEIPNQIRKLFSYPKTTEVFSQKHVPSI